MPQNTSIAVKDLKLDLKNYRTVPQKDEIHAIQAMVRVSPDRFWALMESLLDGGYLPTENIIVLTREEHFTVREGNRRVAALKLILGYVTSSTITIPTHIHTSIVALSEQWKKDNDRLPCAVYKATESALVDQVVTLAHGKGEKAGRDQWSAVARARHNRDVNGFSEPALDILEGYLDRGGNITIQQKERWAGVYPLTVLEEALQKIAPRLGVANASDLAKTYPNTTHNNEFETIMYAIGMAEVGFKNLRSKTTDFAVKYGLPPVPLPGTTSTSSTTTATIPSSPAATGTKTAAVAISDPRAVTRALKKLTILGNNRNKVVTLKNEAVTLKIDKNPIAFCFLLRSMFEISAKAYCDDQIGSANAPVYKKPNGDDRKLAETLRDIVSHMTNNNTNNAALRILHGALTEIAKPDSLLSVTSMNNLIHNPKFSVAPGDISTVFGNIFPLLEAMNQ